MEWVKLYASWHNHPKTLDLSLSAKGLWVDALAYVASHETDGFVPAGIVRRIAGEEEGRVLADQLVGAGLWEVADGGWAMHAFTERQDSVDRLGEKRRMARERQQKHRSELVTRDNDVTNAPVTRTDKRREDISVPNGTSPEPSSVAVVETPSKVDQVFAAHRVSTGRNGRYVLDARRRKCIRDALRAYPLDDVLDAVDGWRFVAHNRGENDRRTVYNDLELLLRDAKHIEQFRDAKRAPLSVASRAGPPMRENPIDRDIRSMLTTEAT